MKALTLKWYSKVGSFYQIQLAICINENQNNVTTYHITSSFNGLGECNCVWCHLVKYIPVFILTFNTKNSGYASKKLQSTMSVKQNSMNRHSLLLNLKNVYLQLIIHRIKILHLTCVNTPTFFLQHKEIIRCVHLWCRPRRLLNIGLESFPCHTKVSRQPDLILKKDQKYIILICCLLRARRPRVFNSYQFAPCSCPHQRMCHINQYPINDILYIRWTLWL